LKKGDRRMHKYECLRCDGKGKLWEFTHVLGGVCFKCNGSGSVLLKNKRRVKPPVVAALPTEEELAAIALEESKRAERAKAEEIAEEMAKDLRFDHAYYIIDALVVKKGDFVKSIMRELVEEGRFPKGKAADIVVEIMGKHMGEEAGKAEFEKAKALFNKK
tara:strand:- start:522 stop:1004 length:483 start_codon:yes stop_codon:yes gene_type:complete